MSNILFRVLTTLIFGQVTTEENLSQSVIASFYGFISLENEYYAYKCFSLINFVHNWKIC